MTIITKFHGPTNTRGARISACDEFGNRCSVPYPHELSGEYAHAQAVAALMRKQRWVGEFIVGEVKGGYVFVKIYPGREPHKF